MRHARVLAVSALATAVVVAAAAFAQTTLTPLPDNGPIRTASLEVDFSKTHWGDAKAGQTKATACAACHGADGNSTVEMYPSIAGQSERYVAQQMALIANGQRSSGAAVAMVPFVQNLTPQDMRDIGAYFATQKANAGIADDTAVTDGPYKGMKFYEIGQQLYRGGDAKRGLPACMACHGPSGAGNPGPAYPHLGGQHASYVARRLQEYQAGQTNETDKAHFQIMATVAQKLSEQEVQALSSYLQACTTRPTMWPRRPRRHNRLPPLSTTGRPGPRRRPTAAVCFFTPAAAPALLFSTEMRVDEVDFPPAVVRAGAAAAGSLRRHPANAPLVEGKDYERIAQPGPFQPLAGKIEVVEVFGYTCPHCAHFEPQLEAWAALPADVRFTPVPAAFGGAWDAWALTTTPPTKSASSAATRVFKALHEQGSLPMQNVSADELATFYGLRRDPGPLPPGAARRAVQKKVEAARAFAQRTKVPGTPAIIINGQYLVRGNSFDDQLRIASALIAQARAARGR